MGFWRGALTAGLLLSLVAPAPAALGAHGDRGAAAEFRGSCDLDLTVVATPAFGTDLAPGRDRSRGPGRCSREFMDRRGRAQTMSDTPIR